MASKAQLAAPQVPPASPKIVLSQLQQEKDTTSQPPRHVTTASPPNP
jgi:hypothetical protein